MVLTISKLKIMTTQDTRVIAEDLVRSYLKMAFWVSPLAFWKIYEIAKPYYELIKPYLVN